MNEDLRLLVVDDDEDDCMFLEEAIKELGYSFNISKACDGDELNKIMEKDLMFDLIIMDINMPKKDGKQCLKELKAHEKYRHIPVVMFTVSQREKDVEESYSYGAHYYSEAKCTNEFTCNLENTFQH